MKLFHLSDLHIGLKLINYDLGEDQEFIFDQIQERVKENKPDVIVIAGDIYDKSVPPAEAYELFDIFINKLFEAYSDTTIMMISGNHDSAVRINTFRNVLSKHKLYMIGMPPTRPEDYIEKVAVSDEYGDVNFYLLPFVKPSMIKQIVGVDENGNNLSYDEAVTSLINRENIDASSRNVLVSHQLYLPVGTRAEELERMDNEIVTVGNIDQVNAKVLENFDYAALGHIHKPMKVGSEFYRYCGTPIQCSISEEGQEKGIIEVELKEKGNVTTRVISLEPKRAVRTLKGKLEDILKDESDDYVRVVLTDKEDLDVIDMHDRIKNAYPHLLEIQRENIRKVNYEGKLTKHESMDPLELCKNFLPGLDEEELEILTDVINTVKGGE